jgi:hypothetical protein
MSQPRSLAGHRAWTLDVHALALMLLAVAGCTTERPVRLIAGWSDTVVVNTARRDSRRRRRLGGTCAPVEAAAISVASWR